PLTFLSLHVYPDNNDLMADCRVNTIALQVNLCTALWAGFDPANLALNSQHNNRLFQGIIDTSVDPLVYPLPTSSQSLQVVNEVPSSSGPFSQFSSVQSVVITGDVDTPSSSVGIISCSTDLYYHFSCLYPLEYLISNTRIA
ncbi:hypothetical protein P4O66_017644, partial [Electrophorus voltai]